MRKPLRPPEPNNDSDYLWETGQDVVARNFLGHEKARYGFVLRTATGDKEFVFPINPKSIEQDEEGAVSITPTQGGGKYIENQGNIFKDITIGGTTGFLPVKNFKHLSSEVLQAQAVSNLTGGAANLVESAYARVSGYNAFLQLRSLFREYWQLHRLAKVGEQAATFYWINMKDNEVWLVEPLTFRMSRASNSPMTYNYTIRLRTIAKGAAVLRPVDHVTVGNSALTNALRGLAAARDRLNDANTLISGKLDFFNQFRATRSLLVSVIDTAGALSTNLSRMAAGTAEVLDLPRSLITSATANISLVLQQIQNSADMLFSVPVDAMEGLIGVRREMDFVLARNDIFAQKWQSRWDDAVADFSPTHGLDGDSDATTQAGRNRNALSEASLLPGETIFNFAARTTGDATRAHEIILLNGLRWPYFAPSADERMPGTLAPGDVVMVPTVAAQDSNPNLTGNDAPLIGRTDKDEVSGATTTTLLRSGRTEWRINQWVGYTVKMLSGAASGESRLVVSNTANSITVGVAFSVAPSSGDLFTVFFLQPRQTGRGGIAALLGIDLRIRKDPETGLYDLVRSSTGDLGLLRGEENLNQALALKFEMSAGDLILHQWFGLLPVFGQRGSPEALIKLRLNFETTLLSDSRIEAVEELNIRQDRDTYQTVSKLRVKGGLRSEFTSPLR